MEKSKSKKENQKPKKSNKGTKIWPLAQLHSIEPASLIQKQRYGIANKINPTIPKSNKGYIFFIQ